MDGTGRVRWSEVAIFCLIAFALAWIYWIPFLARGTEGLMSFPGPYGFANGMFAPLVAALFMRLAISREGLRGSLGIVRHPKYYLIALFAPVLYAALLVGAVLLTGQSGFTWPGEKPLLLMIPLLLFKSVKQIPLGIGEEYGWRGYLLPRLLPLGEVRATVILGLIWGLWHLPMMVMGLNYPGQNAVVSSIIFMVFVVLMSFPFTWLYIASRGSVLVVALLHITLDVFTDIFCSPACLPEGNQLFVSSAGITSCILLGMIIFVRYAFFGDKLREKVRQIAVDGA